MITGPVLLHLLFFSIKIMMLFFFFFQAEDGIRDWSVTGVQTCALPISLCRTHLEVQEGDDDSENAPQVRRPLLLHRASIFLSSKSRSRTFCVNAAARASSTRASSKRPSLASRSPRTLGRR